jgi:hypothetical protein
MLLLWDTTGKTFYHFPGISADVFILRGSAVTSRVAQLQSGRFDGFAFLALGYMPPNPNFEIHKVNEMTKQRYGYHLLGYQIYHSQPGTAETIESHVRSFDTGLPSTY